jgi:nitroreductase
MKRFYLFVVTFMLISGLAFSQEKDNAAIDVITDNFAASQWAAGTIPQTDIEKIVNAGIRSPSSMNRQPWFFTVVQSKAVLNQIIRGMPDGNIIIVVSATKDPEKSPHTYLDIGLATENIYLAAQALGLGSYILTGPVDNVNRNLKSDLGLGRNENVMILVLIGKTDAKPDAVSGASPRKKAGDVVTYKR